MGSLSPRARTWSRASLLLAVVVLLDQVTKALVRHGVRVGSEDSVLPGVSIVHTKNRGVAFSALEDKTAIVVLVIALAMIALLVYVWRHVDLPGIWVPTGLLVGGAIGNIIDRVIAGEVTDFIKLPVWPAFNVADMGITFGVLALLYVIDGAPDEGKSSPGGSDSVADTSPAARSPRAAADNGVGVAHAPDGGR
jgi:signal peptidase II